MYHCCYRNHRSERAGHYTTCTAATVTVTGNYSPVTINQTNVSKCDNQAGDSISPNETKQTSLTKTPGGSKMKKRTQGIKSLAPVARIVTAGVVMLGLLLDVVGGHSAQSYDF